MSRPTTFALALGLLLSAVGCGKPYLVRTQAVPNPLFGHCQLTFENVDASHLMVGGKTVQQYRDEKKDESVASFDTDVVESYALFVRAASERVPGAIVPVAPFAIRPHFTYWEPGFYAGIVSSDSVAEYGVEIVDRASGRVLDDVGVRVVVGAGLANPSSGGRMRTAGSALGRSFGRYLQDRCNAP
jgi:hypothetical protein